MGRYIIAYDITDNRRRVKVSSILENEGLRLQKSLFIIDVAPLRITGIANKLSILLRDNDLLLMTPICGMCMDKAAYYGPGPLVSLMA